jgi:hypothetical protein
VLYSYVSSSWGGSHFLLSFISPLLFLPRLRVSRLRPAPLLFSSAGAAGRSGDRRGARATSVHSSYRIWVGLASGATGVMPRWSFALQLAGGAEHLPSSSYSLPPWWRLRVGERLGKDSSISLVESQIWPMLIMSALFLQHAVVVLWKKGLDLVGVALDLELRGVSMLAVRFVKLYPMPLRRPRLLELKINIRHVSSKLFGWLGWITGHWWLCRQKPMPSSSTSTGEALFTLLSKDLAGDGGQSFSGEVAACFRTRLRFCSILWGPVCIKEGHVCNFNLFGDPLRSIVTLLIV